MYVLSWRVCSEAAKRDKQSGAGTWTMETKRVSTNAWFTLMFNEARAEAINSLHKAPLVSPPLTMDLPNLPPSLPTSVPQPSNLPHTSELPSSHNSCTVYPCLTHFYLKYPLKGSWSCSGWKLLSWFKKTKFSLFPVVVSIVGCWASQVHFHMWWPSQN